MTKTVKFKTNVEATIFYKHKRIILSVHGVVTELKEKDIIKFRDMCDLLLSDTCPEHPEYKAIRKPRTKCLKCIQLYKDKKSEKI